MMGARINITPNSCENVGKDNIYFTEWKLNKGIHPCIGQLFVVRQDDLLPSQGSSLKMK